MEITPKKPHAVVFPFPTQGHINPMMLLANQLLAADITVTFVHSARSFSMLQKSKSTIIESQERSPDIRFEVLPDAVSADDKENPVSPSVALFLSSIPVMKEKLEEAIQRLLEEAHPPSCIISDSFLPWTQDVANKFSIPRIEFWTSSVTVYSMGYYIPQLLSRGYLPVQPGADQETLIDIIPGIGSWRLADFFYDLTFHPISSPIFHFLRDAFSRAKEAQRVIVHSIYDLERDIIHALQDEGIPIDPIGPLLPSVEGSQDNATHKKLTTMSLLPEDDGCLEWLDAQVSSSVIYASFGSNVKISLEEIQELALGLEDSQQPFLLVVRPDLIAGRSFFDIMPEGFEIRTKERGRISSWVPQLAVLAHPAVGGFLTHCGWNSILEAMWMGIPLIGCPRESEQNTNLKCLTDWKAAIALDAGKSKVEIKRDLVGKAISTLMNAPEGEIVRRGILEVKQAARHAMEGGHSRSNLQKLAEDIKEMTLGKRPNFPVAKVSQGLG